MSRVNAPNLFVFAGLPGSGKSTIAQMLSTHLNCAFLRIDTLEQALRELCSVNVEGEGYGLAFRVAADNLKLGVNVVADSCNPITLTRHEWAEVAEKTGSRCINIEIVCSDAAEHRRRIEQRPVDISGLELPTWEQVQDREYHAWELSRIVLDTAGSTSADSFSQLIQLLDQEGV